MAASKLKHCMNADVGIPFDVTFILGQGEDIENVDAHKLVLALSSSVLRAQFFGRARDERSQVKIPDSSPAAFKLMMQFIYNPSHRLHTSSIDIYVLCEVYYLADKYCLLLLKESKSYIYIFLI